VLSVRNLLNIVIELKGRKIYCEHTNYKKARVAAIITDQILHGEESDQ
jgi:hypothetical protein